MSERIAPGLLMSECVFGVTWHSEERMDLATPHRCTEFRQAWIKCHLMVAHGESRNRITNCKGLSTFNRFNRLNRCGLPGG